jgi:excalibur calcium-binding domain-containing protein
MGVVPIGVGDAPPTPLSVPAAHVRVPRQWKNCTVVNKRFPHGIGKLHAHDRTKSGTPVTNFRRSTLLYNRAMRYNRGLDRDKDGVGCEKL